MVTIQQAEFAPTWILPIHVESWPNHIGNLPPGTRSKNDIEPTSFKVDALVDVIAHCLDQEEIGRQRKISA